MSSTLTRAFAEITHLPVLQVRDRRTDQVRCSAFVNAFAVTRTEDRYTRPNGSGRAQEFARGLWYLSLIGAPGTGTTLQAIYGAAVENNTSHWLHLEGVGKVVLGNQRRTLIDQGDATHWHYVQEPCMG